MLVVNRITEAGGIRRVDLLPDIVKVKTMDGQVRTYRLSEDSDGKIERVGEEGK